MACGVTESHEVNSPHLNNQNAWNQTAPTLRPDTPRSHPGKQEGCGCMVQLCSHKQHASAQSAHSQIAHCLSSTLRAHPGGAGCCCARDPSRRLLLLFGLLFLIVRVADVRLIVIVICMCGKWHRRGKMGADSRYTVKGASADDAACAHRGQQPLHAPTAVHNVARASALSCCTPPCPHWRCSLHRCRCGARRELGTASVVVSQGWRGGACAASHACITALYDAIEANTPVVGAIIAVIVPPAPAPAQGQQPRSAQVELKLMCCVYTLAVMYPFCATSGSMASSGAKNRCKTQSG